MQFHSQLIERNIYIGFLVDWMIELFGVLCTSFTLISVASLYIGLCLYIGGMVADLRTKMAKFDHKTPVGSITVRSIYVQALQFHADIIE